MVYVEGKLVTQTTDQWKWHKKRCPMNSSYLLQHANYERFGKIYKFRLGNSNTSLLSYRIGPLTVRDFVNFREIRSITVPAELVSRRYFKYCVVENSHIAAKRFIKPLSVTACFTYRPRPPRKTI